MNETVVPGAAQLFLPEIWAGLGGDAANVGSVQVVGAGDLPSAFAVSDLAAAAIAAAGLAAAELVAAHLGDGAGVIVDRRLASFWFAGTIAPDGWAMAPIWDPVAGDYRAIDGWIRLHTNAPHHRAAALSVLDVAGDKQAVAAAVSRWQADNLEAAIVARGGCAATMRTSKAWRDHPQGSSVAAEPLLWQADTDVVAKPAWSLSRARPLASVRVLDLTRVLAGPTATRFLAGLGADVLRIDAPDWDEPPIVPEMSLGKRCARLDLRRAADRQRFVTLLAEADILVHGYRPEALARLGFDAAERRRIRPGLVDISLDAYGWTGPWRERRGFDSLVQMSAGIAAEGMRRFDQDKPTPLPVQALDHAAGYLMAAAALRGVTCRLTTGVGSETRVSLARTASLLMSQPAPEGQTPFAKRTPADFQPVIEQTSWGPARRLKAPLSIDGVAIGWDRPATALGSAEARW